MQEKEITVANHFIKDTLGHKVGEVHLLSL